MKKLFIICFLICMSCTQEKKHSKVIILQPLGSFESKSTNEILEKIKKINPNVIVRKAIDFPLSSYYKPNNRFRADSIIKSLKSQIGEDSVIVALSKKDISTTKGKIKDWGIMGLGYNPGKACIISDFRLSKKNKKEQFYKVVLHELGHTEGLPHCKIKTCLMRDAEGGNPIDDEIDFCKSCRSFLKSKNWK